uniref:EGF-like domain-containing protein n=1 Tax=Chenopodium quinoa TaxID=63459 RepID=A0A803KPS1_CHEQI
MLQEFKAFNSSDTPDTAAFHLLPSFGSASYGDTGEKIVPVKERRVLRSIVNAWVELQQVEFDPFTGSINYSCMPAAAPLPPIPTKPFDTAIFNPCYWVYCGEGTCTNSSDYKHSCECQPGSYNLFNVSHFPCYSDCAFGSDCSKLGINVTSNSKTSVTGSSSSINQISRSENH